MNTWRYTGLIGAGALGLGSLPALAQIAPATQQVEIYAGGFFGQDLTNEAISGDTPKVDNAVAFGGRYGYNFTEMFGAEISAGHSPTKVNHIPGGGDIDLSLTTVDVSGVVNFNLRDRFERFTPYGLIGVGYVFADLDRTIDGIREDNLTPVSLDSDNGVTFHAGIGIRYFPADKWQVRWDGRYRYFDKLTDSIGHSLNTYETSLSIGYRF